MPSETIKFSLKRQSDGLWVGELVIPVGPPGATRGQAIAITAADAKKPDALKKAAGVAEQILANPIIQAALPPGTGAAISAVKTLASGGTVRAVGEGAKRLASALKFW